MTDLLGPMLWVLLLLACGVLMGIPALWVWTSKRVILDHRTVETFAREP